MAVLLLRCPARLTPRSSTTPLRAVPPLPVAPPHVRYELPPASLTCDFPSLQDPSVAEIWTCPFPSCHNAFRNTLSRNAWGPEFQLRAPTSLVSPTSASARSCRFATSYPRSAGPLLPSRPGSVLRSAEAASTDGRGSTSPYLATRVLRDRQYRLPRWARRSDTSKPRAAWNAPRRLRWAAA